MDRLGLFAKRNSSCTLNFGGLMASTIQGGLDVRYGSISIAKDFDRDLGHDPGIRVLLIDPNFTGISSVAGQPASGSIAPCVA